MVRRPFHNYLIVCSVFLFVFNTTSLAQEIYGTPISQQEPVNIEALKVTHEEAQIEKADVIKIRRKLTVDECIQVAMDNNLSLVIGKKQLKLAKSKLNETKRKLGPTLNAVWEETSGKIFGRHYEGRKISFEGKQPVFYGGELIYAVNQARVNVEIVRNDYKRVKNDLILQVKKAYHNLDKAKEAHQIQKRLYEKAQVFYDTVNKGYDAGMISQLEHLKLSSQFNQIEFQMLTAKDDVATANLILQQAMNIDGEIDIIDVEEPQIIPDLDLQHCFTLAYFNRPEMKTSKLSIAYFDYERKIAKARITCPKVDLIGSYGKATEQYVKMDRSATASGEQKRGMIPEYYIGTKISWPFWGSTLGYSVAKEKWSPVVSAFQGTEALTQRMTISLFDKLEDISAAQEGEVEYFKSTDEYNKKKQEVTLEVREGFFSYKKAVMLMSVAESKILFQKKQVEILEVRKDLGEAEHSDVVEEMIKLAEEEYSQAQAIADYYIAIAILNKAVGINDYFEM